MAGLQAVERYGLDQLKVGESVLIQGDYTRKYHVLVSNRAQNYAKHMARKYGVLLTFKTRRAVTEEQGGKDEYEGVVIRRVPYKAPAHRPKRRKKKYRRNLMAAL